MTIGSIVFVVYVVLTAINLFLSTLESVRDYLAKCGLLTLPRVPAKVPLVGVAIPEGVVAALNTPILLAQKYLVDPVKHWQHRTIIPLEGGHGSTLGGTIATMASATAACLFLSATPDLLALARGGADKAAAEAIAWTLGTALGLATLSLLFLLGSLRLGEPPLSLLLWFPSRPPLGTRAAGTDARTGR